MLTHYQPSSSLLESALGLLLLHWDVEMYSTTTWLAVHGAMWEEKTNCVFSMLDCWLLTFFADARMYPYVCMTYVWFKKNVPFLTQESPHQRHNTRDETQVISLPTHWGPMRARDKAAIGGKWYLDTCDHWFVGLSSGSEDLKDVYKRRKCHKLNSLYVSVVWTMVLVLNM